jgi:hypothetical protein
MLFLKQVIITLLLAWSGLNRFLTLRLKLVLIGNYGYLSAIALEHMKPLRLSNFASSITLSYVDCPLTRLTRHSPVTSWFLGR